MKRKLETNKKEKEGKEREQLEIANTFIKRKEKIYEESENKKTEKVDRERKDREKKYGIERGRENKYYFYYLNFLSQFSIFLPTNMLR